MNFAIRRIDHVVLYVADQERSVRFYRDVLGCQVVRRNPDANLVHLGAGDSMIDLLPRPEGNSGRNVDHVALRIDPFDADALTLHLAGFGITPGAVKDRFGAEGTGPSLYFDDPDGNTIEIKGPAQAMSMAPPDGGHP
jgi:catechol 2,3-dioxygenase-like lactoylglutathione lyase family enzyme